MDELYDLIWPEFQRVFGDFRSGGSYATVFDDDGCLTVEYFEQNTGKIGTCFKMLDNVWHEVDPNAIWGEGGHPPLSVEQKEWLDWSASVARGNLVKSASKQ